VANLCRSDAAKWEAAEGAGLGALQARLDLCDGVSDLLGSSNIHDKHGSLASVGTS